MKWYEIAALGVGAYFLITKLAGGSNPTTNTDGGGSYIPQSFSPPAGTYTPQTENSTIQTNSYNIPGTEIPASSGFHKAVEFAKAKTGAASDSDLIAIAKKPLGSITVSPPARDLQGKTAWDLRIEQNFAAQGKAIPYK